MRSPFLHLSCQVSLHYILVFLLLFTGREKTGDREEGEWNGKGRRNGRREERGDERGREGREVM